MRQHPSIIEDDVNSSYNDLEGNDSDNDNLNNEIQKNQTPSGEVFKSPNANGNASLDNKAMTPKSIRQKKAKIPKKQSNMM